MNFITLFIVFAFQISTIICVEFCKKDTEKLCQNNKGKLSIQEKDAVLCINGSTVFLANSPKYTFRCENLQGSSNVYIEKETNNSSQNNEARTFSLHQLTNNGMNATIGCNDVCNVTVIVVKFKANKTLCNDTSQGFHCDLASFHENASIPTSLNHRIIGYSIFDPIIGTWQQCTELDENEHEIIDSTAHSTVSKIPTATTTTSTITTTIEPAKQNKTRNDPSRKKIEGEKTTV